MVRFLLISIAISVFFFAVTGCGYHKYGKTPDFPGLRKDQFDSVTIFRPLVKASVLFVERGTVLSKPGETFRGISVDQVAAENWKCITNEIIGYFDDKVYAHDLTIDESNAVDEFFNELLLKKTDLRESSKAFLQSIPIVSNSGLILFTRIKPHESVASSYSGGGSYIERMALEVVAFNNADKNLVGYCSTRAYYLHYKVSNKRCRKLIEYVFRKMEAPSTSGKGKIELRK